MKVCTAACLLLASIALPGQTVTSNPDDPVRILKVTDAAPGEAPVLEAELYNRSGKGIVAYALVLRGDGAEASTREIKVPEAGNEPIPNSTRWTKRIGSGIPTNVSDVFVDFVRFEDGKTWGPNRSRSAEWVDGFLAGFRIAKERYRKVLKDEGRDALEAELKRN